MVPFRGLRAPAIGLIATLIWVCPALAQPRSFALNWVREPHAESCVTSRELARLIEQAAGPVFALPSEAEFSIEGQVQKDASGWSARIAISDAHGARLGERLIRTAQADCRALNPQIVLVVAMIIDPEGSLDRLPRELLDSLSSSDDPGAELLAELQQSHPPQRETRPIPQEAAAAPPVRAAVPPKPPAAAAREPRSVFGLEGGLALGQDQLDSATVGPWLGARLGLGRFWSFALRALIWLPNDVMADDAAGAHARMQLTMLLTSLQACASPLRGRLLELSLCGGLSGAVRWVDASEIDVPNDANHWTAGPAASAQLALAILTRMTVLLTTELDFPLSRPSFTYIDGRGVDRQLFAPGPVAVSVWLGASWAVF